MTSAGRIRQTRAGVEPAFQDLRDPPSSTLADRRVTPANPENSPLVLSSDGDVEAWVEARHFAASRTQPALRAGSPSAAWRRARRPCSRRGVVRSQVVEEHAHTPCGRAWLRNAATTAVQSKRTTFGDSFTV